MIEDDPVLLCLLEALLSQRIGCQVLKALNGREADLAIAKHSDRLSLIHLDLNMPDFDGIEFLSALHARKVGVPLIIASGAIASVRQSAEALARAYGLNLIGSLSKPLDFDRFTSLAMSAFAKAAGHTP